MSLDKINIGVTKRSAPAKGPTSSIDYNACMDEISSSLAQIYLVWNMQLQPLIDSLPGGSVNVNALERSSNPNPFKNGFDGSQIFTDMTSSLTTDDGFFYEELLKRPSTIKESFKALRKKINQDIEKLEIKIAQINKDNLLTNRQKQLIGSNIFDLGSVSSSDSLDGRVDKNSRTLEQLVLDIYGSPSAVTNAGTKTLLFSIFDQLKTLQAAHRYNDTANTVDHRHLKFHEHRYHVVPEGAVDNNNLQYKLPYVQGSTSVREQFITGSLRVYINGVEQQKGFIYSEDADNAGFTLLRTPLEADGLGADDILWVHYDIDITGEK